MRLPIATTCVYIINNYILIVTLLTTQLKLSKCEGTNCSTTLPENFRPIIEFELSECPVPPRICYLLHFNHPRMQKRLLDSDLVRQALLATLKFICLKVKRGFGIRCTFNLLLFCHPKRRVLIKLTEKNSGGKRIWLLYRKVSLISDLNILL